MGVAGSLTYDTKLDTKGFQKGVNDITNKAKSGGSTVKNIVSGLGITKIISSAINTITNSLDGAISRFDIMNNFPKVLKNLGFSADDAKRSINKLADGLDGLPTALDSAVVSVQRLVSKNGDIDKSTKYFLAMNNAILSGGASMTIQESALEQLTQSYSKGKPDLMEWRTLQMAMPGQLKQVAIAMGYVSASDLYEDFKDGVVSMDEFMDTIVKLNKEGINGFASFEDQAKDATGGISTSLTNLKTRIKKGLTTILDNINKSLAKNGTSISKIIDTIGTNIKNMLESIGKSLPKIIDFAIKGFEIVKKILPYITPLIVGFASFLAILKALEIINTITSAFKAFNLVLMANPIVLIISGIVALIAGIVLLWNKCKAFRDFWINLWDGIKKAFDIVVEFIKNNWKSMLLFLVNPLAGIFKLLYDNFDGFREFIDNFVQGIKDFFVNAWENIKTFFTETIPNTISEFIQKVIGFFNQLPYYIGYVIGLIIGTFAKWIENIKNFITVTIPEFINSVIVWFQQLPGKIAEFMSSVWEKIKELGSKLVQFATEDIPNFINGVVNWFKELSGKIWEFLKSAFNNVKNWGSDLIQKGKQIAKDFFNSIINTIKELPNKMLNIGENIVKGIWNGINNAKDWLINKVHDFTKGITDGIKKSLGIKSPSRIMRDQVGQWIPKGIAVGIEANTDSALKSLDELSDEITTKMQNAVNMETGTMSFSGTTGSVSQILSSNATFDGNFVVKAEVQEGTLFEANQRITKEKRLQTGFGG